MSSTDTPNNSALRKAKAKIVAERALFSIRRPIKRLNPRSIWSNSNQIVVIDWDETLSRANTYEELFKHKLGAEKGVERYNFYRNLVKNGHFSLSEAALKGHAELVDIGITLRDYEFVFEKLVREGKIRKEILRTVEYLRQVGRKVVLATRSPQYIAELAAERFGFDLAIGSKDIIQKDGKVIGVAQLIGDANRKIPLGAASRSTVLEVTKMSRLKEELSKRGSSFRPKNVTILSDGYDDISAFKKAGCSILLVPQKSGGTQKLSQQFKLRDQEIVERDSTEMERELKLRLRFPRVNHAKKSVQDRVRAFAARKRRK